MDCENQLIIYCEDGEYRVFAMSVIIYVFKHIIKTI